MEFILFLPFCVGLLIVYIIYSRKRPQFILRFFNEHTSGRQSSRHKRNFTKPDKNSKKTDEANKDDEPLFTAEKPMNAEVYGMSIVVVLLPILVAGVYFGIKGINSLIHHQNTNAQEAISSDSSANSSNKNNADTTSKTVSAPITNLVRDSVLGIWSGESDSRYISFIVDKINGPLVTGYLIVDGKFSEFEGKIDSNGSGYKLTLDGYHIDNVRGAYDLAYDGTKQIINGRWESNDGSLSLRINLTRVTKGRAARVILSSAYEYTAPDYSTKTSEFLQTGDTVEFDSLNRLFIHCTYHINDEEKSGWFTITDFAFQ